MKRTAIIMAVFCLLAVSVQAQQTEQPKWDTSATTLKQDLKTLQQEMNQLKQRISEIRYGPVEYGLSLNLGIAHLLEMGDEPLGAGVLLLLPEPPNNLIHAVFLDFTTAQYSTNLEYMNLDLSCRANTFAMSYALIGYNTKSGFGFGPLIGIGMTTLRTKASMSGTSVSGSTTKLTLNYGAAIRADGVIFRVYYTSTGEDMEPRGVLFGVSLPIGK